MPAPESIQTRLRCAWWSAVALALFGSAFSVAYRFAKLVVSPAVSPDAQVEIRQVDDDGLKGSKQRVWMAGPDVDLDGSYSFIFDAQSRATQHLAGHARLGPVLARRGKRSSIEVQREVLSLQRGELHVGTKGRITGWWYSDAEELGYSCRLVALPLPDGIGWGWVISPEAPVPGRWAVHVHGRGAMPQETLRGVRVFAEAGYTSLVIAYRNDPGAPAGIAGRYGLGLAESQDVDAAVGWVKSQGADSVTLVGWSMGGTATVLAAGVGNHRRIVDGLVLDSPALDWPGLLKKQARQAHVPFPIASLGLSFLKLGIVRGALARTRKTQLSELTPRRLAPLIKVPTLIHAGPGDTFVPWSGSLQVAQMRGNWVRINPIAGEHVKHWNASQTQWEVETTAFLRDLHPLP